jgi:hypothetical protein
MDRIFFDSHGLPWWTCAPDDVRAIVYGPTGAARPVLWSLSFSDVSARTFVDDGWTYLLDAGIYRGRRCYRDRWGDLITPEGT